MVGAKAPAAQPSHAPAPLLAEKLPALQFVQPLAPTAEKVPELQLVHNPEVVALNAVENWPAAQPVHAAAAVAAANVPGPQLAHEAAPTLV